MRRRFLWLYWYVAIPTAQILLPNSSPFSSSPADLWLRKVQWYFWKNTQTPRCAMIFSFQISINNSTSAPGPSGRSPGVEGPATVAQPATPSTPRVRTPLATESPHLTPTKGLKRSYAVLSMQSFLLLSMHTKELCRY